jgi:hypothetical protein
MSESGTQQGGDRRSLTSGGVVQVKDAVVVRADFVEEGHELLGQQAQGAVTRQKGEGANVVNHLIVPPRGLLRLRQAGTHLAFLGRAVLPVWAWLSSSPSSKYSGSSSCSHADSAKRADERGGSTASPDTGLHAGRTSTTSKSSSCTAVALRGGGLLSPTDDMLGMDCIGPIDCGGTEKPIMGGCAPSIILPGPREPPQPPASCPRLLPRKHKRNHVGILAFAAGDATRVGDD